MARPLGVRNPHFAERRDGLVRLARGLLTAPGGQRSSMRDLARACMVSVPTLRHYFPRREDLLKAVMAQQGADGAPHLARMAAPSGDFARSVGDVVQGVVEGFRRGVGEVFALGLLEGLRDAEIGPAFLAEGLDPTLGAVARRLDAHMEAAEMRRCDPRHAALALLAPVLLACLHQMELGGGRASPLDLDAFARDHAEGFVRAYAAPVRPARPPDPGRTRPRAG